MSTTYDEIPQNTHIFTGFHQNFCHENTHILSFRQHRISRRVMLTFRLLRFSHCIINRWQLHFQLLQQNRISVQVLKTPDQWFGVTYKEDREAVMQSIRDLVEKGVYEKDLYSDLR